MNTPKKIVVVDDEEQIRRLVANSLPAPEFEVASFSDGRDALMKLHDLGPDLILCDVMMPEMDGRTFFQVVKRSEQLRHVPFIFLSAVHATDQIVATLEAGADDFVNKPFSPPRLLAKVRAVLRLAGRTAPFVEDRRLGDLQGELGAKGTLPLVKFCESVRLTGRLTVTAPGVTRWADFLGGELVQAGGQPERAGEEPIDLLLTMQAGSYQVEQRKLDANQLTALSAVPSAGAVRAVLDPGEGGKVSADDGPVHMPGGRLTRLDVRGESITIQTEAENRPDFTVTTLIARDGQVLRKLESSWPHPLQRRADQAAADAHILRQHERMVASLRDLTVEPPAPSAAATVDGALLAWAVSFVAEQARDLLGAVMTVALLRRTHGRLLREHETLRAFKVGPDGRVLFELGTTGLEAERAALPAAGVPAVAGWVTAFLTEAGGMAEKAGRIRVRAATHMMEADLDRIGFYSLLGAAGTA